MKRSLSFGFYFSNIIALLILAFALPPLSFKFFARKIKSFAHYAKGTENKLLKFKFVLVNSKF